mmetsp:Transcript_100107/g.161386  ORF Transcript_100107/g.161386 Transcript_100107/m.161386 type:complete len:179 (+) Transcript_100107:97-633(+)|eukprot:CAMPEP_0179421738 /NCGR_PEP_ID=MMETSP0799-20121207/9982_1 /TAXON_ID=46947 /ORGANISM="Geminigera cryophila, Strain CCMP2564" /LENGTH=178 /DNA_ID=CAMNT_0021195677 /DNA_START=62 /DNA_END=598 /DNA_ORIENTATION=+
MVAHKLNRKRSLPPQQRSLPQACPGRKCAEALESTNFRSRHPVPMEVKTCSIDTCMMSASGDEGLSSFAFEMEMDDLEYKSQAEYMLAISPPDEYSSICTLLSVSTWEKRCAASVIEMTSSTGTVLPILDTYSVATTVGHLAPLHPRNPAPPCLPLVCSHQLAEGLFFFEGPSTTGVQ